MGLIRRLLPAACVALAACEQPPEVAVPMDAGADGFHWEDTAPPVDAPASSDGAPADGQVADGGPVVDGGPIDVGTSPLPYTIIFLPDTQYYASNFPQFFDAQTAWIVSEHASGNIAFVLHSGDIVDNDTVTQWTRAYNSLRMLEGVVPYALSPGNHDYCCDGWPTDRAMTMINDFFPLSTFEGRPSFKGAFEAGRVENTAHLFDVPGGQWLVLALEWGPRDVVLNWADGVAKQYADTPTIVITHAYLYDDDTRYDHVARPNQQWNPHSYPVGDNDGEEIWQKLVLGNSNIRFVLSGHVLNTGVGRLTSTRPDGTVVHQILADYQVRANGGEGFLRVMRFFPEQHSVHVQTFSPASATFMTDGRNDFTLAY